MCKTTCKVSPLNVSQKLVMNSKTTNTILGSRNVGQTVCNGLINSPLALHNNTIDLKKYRKIFKQDKGNPVNLNKLIQLPLKLTKVFSDFYVKLRNKLVSSRVTKHPNKLLKFLRSPQIKGVAGVSEKILIKIKTLILHNFRVRLLVLRF